MKDITVLKNQITVGLEKPVRFLHLTDTHIVRDSKKQNGRAAVFGTTDEQIEHYFLKALEYAKQNNLFIIHTGDLIDYITDENLEFIDKHFADVDYIFASGSHEFIHLIPGSEEYKAWREAGNAEDDDFKRVQINVVAPHFKNNIYFSSKVVNGVNVVALDDSYSTITEGQLDALKAEVAKGYPIIIAMHIPIHTKGLKDANITPRENLCSTPEEQKEYALKNNKPELAKDIRIFSESTWEAVEYIKNEPLIKLVLAGHRHRDIVDDINENKYQMLTHANCQGFVREITLV